MKEEKYKAIFMLFITIIIFFVWLWLETITNLSFQKRCITGAVAESQNGMVQTETIEWCFEVFN
jgi:hypothetical protein